MSLNYTNFDSLNLVEKSDRKLRKLRSARGNAAAVLNQDMKQITRAIWGELIPMIERVLRRQEKVR